jgi:hypothetical protein
MVAIRRYGPVLGAGTTITEKLSEVAIVPSPLGIVAWAGIMEKGDPGELIIATSKSDMHRKTGGRTPDSYMPYCNDDFWDEGRGAGRQLLVRVTDGTERKSTLILKTREYDGAGTGAWRNVMQLDAKSGGRWAGGDNRRIGEITGSGDLTETTIDTGLTLLLDEFANGVLTMAELTGETFEIVGNTTAGIVTVKGDSQLLTKFGSGTDNEFTLYKNDLDTLGNTKKLAVLVKDGARDPANEFGMEFYQNDEKVLNYDDLSLDSNSDVYFVDAINDDTLNEEVRVTDLFTGTIVPITRPANQAGDILSGNLAALVLTLEWQQTAFDSGNTGVGVMTAVTAKASTQRDFITLEVTDDTTPGSEVWSVTSTEQDRTFTAATTAVPYVGPNDFFIDFTIAAGAPAWTNGDKIYITVEPVKPAEAINGKLYYDTENSPFDSLTIVDATPTTVSVRAGNDLTALSSEGQPYRLEYREGLEKGYDGHSGVVDNDYIAVFDLDNSLFNQHRNKQLGLIKFAVPGVSSTSVQKAARTYGEANNSPFREEVPSNIVTETAAVDWSENTMGRNDFAQAIFPSWYYVQDPDRPSALKLIPVTGAVQGYEALSARAWNGYHKAAAGTSAVLSRAVKLPTGDKVLDDEITNPKGLQIILKKEGNWVIWGDRVPATSTGLKFKHKREQLSHYERVLFENFDWIIFAINDVEQQNIARTALTAYFVPEWKPKRALRGATFPEAASIKVDAENNTEATIQAGNLNAEIKLRLAETVERFNLILSTAGIFEEVVA